MVPLLVLTRCPLILFPKSIVTIWNFLSLVMKLKGLFGNVVVIVPQDLTVSPFVFTAFWDTIEEDVVRFVQEFSISHEIPKGCNPSFIALIPKTPNAKFVSDFHPISLIGCQYKLIGKLLANRLSNVIGDLVSFNRLSLKGGLKINIDKSKVLGVGVSDEEISHMAHIIGCGISKCPFKYLGVPVGCNMNRCVNWSAITNIFTSKLSSWKARLLSIGGRLSLIKAVLGNLPTYFMSIYLMPVSIRSKLESMRSKFFRGADQNDSKMAWIKWEKCLSSKKKGGLGIGNGASTRFWEDTWCGNSPLKLQFPRIYNLDTDRNCLISNRIPFNWSSVLRRLPRGGAELNQFEALGEAIRNVSLTDQSDSWTWSIGVGYSVASTRVLVDEKLLDSSLEATRWIRYIPIKVNVFLWRLNLNKLPSRVNLDRKGIEVSSLLCPTCQIDVETVNHIFFNCEMAKDLWSLLAKWWELDIPFCSNISDWYDWLDDACVAANIRLVLEGVGGTLMWAIWSFRNHLIFSNPPPKKATLWDFIVSQSFLWFSSRNPTCKVSWIGRSTIEKISFSMDLYIFYEDDDMYFLPWIFDFEFVPWIFDFEFLNDDERRDIKEM
ncbi:RNA-directed DNA polymerase, eukaryota, reverse transcriptase zinc-binding domain protein [Tanacetum coccineum]|uniref:RNA-directed DNA polymerase, eukaryota, reverse transcriptase zinc-binding domain protein n=1 Tax=Tanacetum coccineum TaxID=301880 RepID=A0ABQ5GCW6_9ASTR